MLEQKGRRNLMSDKMVCRIKRDSSIFYALPVHLKGDKTIDDVKKNNVKSISDKNYDECFEKPYSRKVDRYSKYYSYIQDDGVINYSDVPTSLLPYLMIDKKIGIYNQIEEIINESGYKYNSNSSLKQHIYLGLKEYNYSDSFIKKALDYFFEKSIKSFADKKKRFLNKAYANLDEWNYFATFTYDDKLMTGEQFEKKLKTYLKNIKNNYDVKYMGAFELSPKGRIHFHCLMSIPDNYFAKLDVQTEQYYFKERGEIRESPISQYLKAVFGRCEFRELHVEDDEFLAGLNYICKYIQKQNSGIVYCRGIKDEFLGIIPDFDDHVMGYLCEFSKFLMMDSETHVERI